MNCMSTFMRELLRIKLLPLLIALFGFIYINQSFAGCLGAAVSFVVGEVCQAYAPQGVIPAMENQVRANGGTTPPASNSTTGSTAPAGTTYDPFTDTSNAPAASTGNSLSTAPAGTTYDPFTDTSNAPAASTGNSLSAAPEGTTYDPFTDTSNAPAASTGNSLSAAPEGTTYDPLTDTSNAPETASSDPAGTTGSGGGTGSTASQGEKNKSGCYLNSCTSFVTLAQQTTADLNELPVAALPSAAGAASGSAAGSASQMYGYSTQEYGQLQANIPIIEKAQADVANKKKTALNNLKAEAQARYPGPQNLSLQNAAIQNDSNAIESASRTFNGEAEMAKSDARNHSGAVSTAANNAQSKLATAGAGSSTGAGGSTGSSLAGGSTGSSLAGGNTGSSIASGARNTASNTGGFFSTTTGKVVGAVAAGGLAYGVVSAMQDDGDDNSSNGNSGSGGSSSSTCSHGKGSKDNCTSCDDGYELSSKKCVKIEAE